MRTLNQAPATGPKSGKLFGIVMTVLAALQLGLSGLTGMVGLFADGGDVWSRLLLVLVHPLVAAGLMLAVILPNPGTRILTAVAALLLVNVGGDATASILIAGETVKGDWWLPLIFSVVPIAGLVYVGKLLKLRHRQGFPNEDWGAR